ncbi:hypothetical protein CYMTET_26516 [Cymbomonas tetramitiformis]|uniref:Uncharacterized protein n=1 Tax=Cymbomonas tetramitiformis TaxID=36881 RepID=A0AAE0FS52_9CHLO|nr:hypothetical protein CYMTET_26516 [Cymbomonas tetramitiformis]|eukprot:gene14755-17434_t
MVEEVSQADDEYSDDFEESDDEQNIEKANEAWCEDLDERKSALRELYNQHVEPQGQPVSLQKWSVQTALWNTRNAKAALEESMRGIREQMAALQMRVKRLDLKKGITNLDTVNEFEPASSTPEGIYCDGLVDDLLDEISDAEDREADSTCAKLELNKEFFFLDNRNEPADNCRSTEGDLGFVGSPRSPDKVVSFGRRAQR